MGRETFRPGGKILTDIAENNFPEVNHKDIVYKHENESVQNLIGNLPLNELGQASSCNE